MLTFSYEAREGLNSDTVQLNEVGDGRSMHVPNKQLCSRFCFLLTCNLKCVDGSFDSMCKRALYCPDLYPEVS